VRFRRERARSVPMRGWRWPEATSFGWSRFFFPFSFASLNPLYILNVKSQNLTHLSYENFVKISILHVKKIWGVQTKNQDIYILCIWPNGLFVQN
jgi:hypothetical protein